MFGTIGYIAPEALIYDQSYDEAIDLYSLGVILYMLVTKKKLFSGN